MKKGTVLLAIASIALASLCHAQEKETVKSGGVDNQITISGTGMYSGSASKKATEYFDEAVQFGMNEDFENAKKFYLKALKEDRKYVEAYDNLGLIYRRLGDFDKAIECYQKSIELFPEGKIARQNLAAVYGIQKNYESAIIQFEAILKISPDDPEGYFGLGNSYMMLARFDEALVNARHALDLYEKNNSHHIGDGYYMIGLIHYYQGDQENAKTYLQSAKDRGVQLHPQLEKALFSNESNEGESQEIQLKTEEDFKKYEPVVIAAYDWLMKTPVDVEPAKRKEINAFLIRWMTGSPNVSIEISEKIVTYLDCADCLMIFMAGWTKYAIESKDPKNKVKGNLAGTESVIEFYLLNKKALGKNKAIEKFIKLKEEGKLEDFIKSNI